MSGRRRRPGRHRASVQAERIGQEIKLARAALGWSRRRAAEVARVARSTLERIEHGDPTVQLDVACSVTSAVGLDLVLTTYPSRQPGLRDSGQMTLARRLAATAGPGWQTGLEVPCGERGEAADVVLFGATIVIHVEIERVLVDFQAQYRRAVAKRQALQAKEARAVRLVLLIEDTKRNRRVIGEHLALIERVLPAGSREILAAVRGGRALGRDGLLWLRPR